MIHPTNTLLMHNNAILKIKNLIKSILSIEDINNLISFITEAQENLTDDMSKNEDILKLFLDKVERLTSNVEINNEFITHFLDIKIKELDVNSLY